MADPRLSLRQEGPLRPARGFTLLEMVVVITIIAILAGALLPVISRPYVTEKRLETINEMGQIEQALVGRWEYGDYGYIGTMGGLPPQASWSSTATPSFVSYLIFNNAQTGNYAGVTVVQSAGAPSGVPVGWNGPYLRSQFQDPTKDGWGTQYELDYNQAQNDTTQWAIRSAGPDRILNTGDDIVIPAQVNAQVSGVVATNEYYYLSQGYLVLDIWNDFGTWQTPLQMGDIASVYVYTPNVFQDGAVLQAQPCAVQVGTSSWPLNDYECSSLPSATNPQTTAPGAPQMIPFGLHSVTITFQPSLCQAQNTKYSSFYTQNCTYTQNVVHERGYSYAKITIPSETASTIQAQESTVDCVGSAPVVNGTATPFCNTSINTPKPIYVPPGTNSTTTEPINITVTAYGNLTLGTVGNTCMLFLAWGSLDGTGNPTNWAYPALTNPQALPCPQCIQDPVAFPSFVANSGNAQTNVPFLLQGTFTLNGQVAPNPGGPIQAAIQPYVYSTGGAACSLVNWVTKVYTTPIQ